MNIDSNALSPDKQELRKFGFVFAAGLIIIFGLFFPWLTERPWPSWPFIVAAIFFVTGLAIPQALMLLYKLWMKTGHVLGWINTRIILGLVFFAVFTPVALALKILGKDPLRRTLDSAVRTYRIPSEKLERERMEKPF
jgi:hypothetical protein